MSARDPKIRSTVATLAVETSWANTTDRSARTAAAREAFEQRFHDEVDPERKLDPAVRAKRAEHARKAYYLRLSLKAQQARAAKRGDAA